jgi:sugar phosphate isomerase/epimerase
MPLARLGTCSWSLRPDNPADLVRLIHATGLDAIQVGLSPIVTAPAGWATLIPRLIEADITLLSGMMAPVGEDYSTLETIAETGGIRPDGTWPSNEAMARTIAVMAENAGIGMMTMHAGFLPEDPSDPVRAAMVERLRTLADIFAAEGLCLALETGQESATVLLDVLTEIDRDRVGINFDPANMVLYGSGDPIEAMETLAPHIFQVHLKDAMPPAREGRWGSQTPLGQGAVDWEAFFRIAASLPREVDAIIEREGGDNPVGEIRLAVDFVRTHLV